MANRSNKKGKQSVNIDTSSDEEEYEVESILDSRINPKTKVREYLVKWENYSEKQATWEPKEHLSNVKDILLKFEKQQPRKAGKKSDAEDVDSKDTKTVKKTEEFKKVVAKTSEQQPRRSVIQRKKDVEPEEIQVDLEENEEEEHISQEEDKTSPQKQNQQSSEEEVEQELVFVEILNKRVNPQGVVEYLIHFQDVENQWVEETQLSSISDEIKAFEAKRSAEELASKQAEAEAQELKIKKTRSKLTAKRSSPFEISSTKQATEETVEKVVAEPTPQVSKIVGKKSIVACSEKPVTKQLETVEIGDFKTDNVEHIELQGDFNDILSSRFEIFWKTRKDGVTPVSSFFSSSYLKRYEPTLLIDYLISYNSNCKSKA